MLGHNKIIKMKRKKKKGGGKALIPSCKGVDYEGNIIFVLLGEKEGKMSQKRIGQKKGEQ